MTRTLRRGASQTDGMLRWKSNEAWPWDAGAIDIKKALGVWLLGPPGWRRLDIILPEHRWTLAADNDDTALEPATAGAFNSLPATSLSKASGLLYIVTIIYHIS